MRFNTIAIFWTLAIAIFVWNGALIYFDSPYVYSVLYNFFVFIDGLLFGIVLADRNT
tara:strand:- start:14 stop:184 length:171 start_codon:yes stop_codon:yes gene_type:complete